MGRDQEIISLSSFGRDLVASGRMEFLNGPKFFTKETKATRRKDLTVAPNESPRPVATSKWTSWSALALATTTTDLEDPEQLIVGGGAVTNVSLVMGSQDGLYFSDLKVMPVPVEGATSSGGSLLVAPVAEQGRAQPMFLLPTDGDSDISFTKHNPSVSFTDLSKELKESEGEIGVAAIDSYVLSGDIKNFFGIQGLTGKLYAFKSDEDKKSKNGGQEKGNKKAGKDATKGKEDPQQTTDNLAKQREEMNLKAKDPKEGKTGGKSEKDKEDKDDKEKPVDEKVLLKDMESPLGIIFPEIENKTIQKLPLKNLEFVFSNTEKESLFPAGLRLQGDLELKDDLEFISHRLKDLFGSDKSTTLPKKIRVTALIAKERDWSKKPKIEGIVLQAALDDMKLPAWDFLEFQTVGIELSARKEAIKKDEVEKKKDYKTGSSKKETEETEPKLEAVKDVAEDDASHTGSKVKVEEVAAEATDVEPTKEKVPSDATHPKADKTKESTVDMVGKDGTDKRDKEDKKDWKVGFGLFGKLSITKVPNSKVPLEARYWIRTGSWKKEEKDDKPRKDNNKGDDGDKIKDGEKKTDKLDGNSKKDKTGDGGDTATQKAITKEEQTDKGKGERDAGAEKEKKGERTEGSEIKYELLIKVGKWKDFCAISNLDMKEAQLNAFFKPGEFTKSCTLSVSGALEFEQGSLDKEKKEEKADKEDDKKADKKADKKTDKTADEAEEEENKPKKATLKINGQLSRKDYHFDAKVGDLKLDSILKIYAQISGARPSKEVKEHDFAFEELHLNISRKLKKKEKEEKEDKKETPEEKEAKKEEKAEKPGAIEETEKGEKDQATKKVAKKEKAGWSFELSGKVSFNDVKSVKGLVKIDNTGLTIEGGVEDYKIKDTDVNIKEASIDIFIGAKPDPAKTKPEGSKPRLTDGTAEHKAIDKPTKIASRTDKLEPKNTATKDAEKGKVAVFNRASKFSIKGKVEFSGLTVTVMFLTERKETNLKSKEVSEREWVLFGVIDGDLRLSKICTELAGTDIGNIQLRNIALIAASGEIKTVKDLNTLKYPVKKGISLCATIPPLAALNTLAKQNVDGLVLVASIHRKLDLQIRLPESFDLVFTESCVLNDIGIGIEISEKPSLMLEGVLNITMESNQDPLRLEGMVKAGILSAAAQVATVSPWVNPFNISKQVTIADFRIVLEITYATLAAAGPSKMALAGDLRIGEFKAEAGMSISHYPDQQLLTAGISKVDLMEIIRVAGKVADVHVLKNMSGGEDIFVFTDAFVYISTGATIAGKEYPRGISAGGSLTAFGKTATFDLSIGAAGLDLQAFIDNFSLGPLVVTSATGDPRAGMIVQMTKDEQVIKVDGKVTCFGIGFAVLVDIQMGTETPSFKAYLAVQFTEAFKISVSATVDNFRDIKDLASKGLLFQGKVEGDLFEAICESIKHMLKSLEELGTQGIESVQNLIKANIAKKKAEMEQLAEKVKEAEEKVAARRRDRQAAMEKEEEKRKGAENEINRLRDNLAKETRKRDHVRRELEEKVMEAKLNKESLIQRKRKEYDDKLKAAKREERENRERLNALQQRQQTKYGTDFLKKVNIAKGAWAEKQAALKASWKGVQWVYRQKCEATFWTIGYWAARLETAKAAHEVVKAATDVYHESAKGLEATANSDAFQVLVTGIEEAQKGVERAVNGLDSLLSGGGFDGFVRSFVDTEEARIQKAINNLRAMQNENSELQKAVRKAQEILDRNGPRLEREIAEADEEIERIQEDSKLAELQRDYEYQLKVHDEVHNVIEGMNAGLETLKENWETGMQQLQEVVDDIQKAIASVIHIERIEVSAHTHALVNDKPLEFVFYGTLAGKRFEIEAKWSPGQSLKGLYKAVTNEILKIA